MKIFRSVGMITNQSNRLGCLVLTGLMSLFAGAANAHSDGGKLLSPPGATAIAQTICGSNTAGETASYSFRIRNLSPAYKDLIKLVVSKDGFAEQVVFSAKKARTFGVWGSVAGGNGVYNLTFIKVLAKSTTRKATVFEIEHHCSAANGGHTENESFVWIKR